MTRLEWDKIGERLYETGVDRGVLYPRLGPGVPWNGLVSVEDSSDGGDLEPIYYDGLKYMDVVGGEDFVATVSAYYAPEEFLQCEGVKRLSPGIYATQQPRSTFGFSYRSLIGNDLVGESYGYKLHLIYGATAEPSGRTYESLSDSPSLDAREWTFQTVPQPSVTYKPTAHLMIDSTKVDPLVLEDLESYLYGRDDREARLVSQVEVLSIFANPITELIEEPI